MPFSFKPSITMTGQPLKHKVSVSDFKQIGDEYYMRVSKSDPSMIGILNTKRIDSEGQRMLSHTDVIETITGIRDSKFTELVAAIVSDENGAPPDGGLACCDEGGCSDQSPGTKRISRVVLAQMPETVTITTPTVGDVQGVDVKVVLGNAHSPLYMHLCEALIKYLSEAVHFQINNMEIKRTRHRKKTKDSNVQPGPPSSPSRKSRRWNLGPRSTAAPKNMTLFRTSSIQQRVPRCRSSLCAPRTKMACGGSNGTLRRRRTMVTCSLSLSGHPLRLQRRHLR